jgi:hypothetical protein
MLIVPYNIRNKLNEILRQADISLSV